MASTEKPRLIAVDVETANSSRDSVCSIGVTVVYDDRVDVYSRLIRPPVMHFDPRNVEVHGITPDMVEDKPRFDEIYLDTKLGEFIDQGILMWAHNAGFERSCFIALSQTYNITLSDRFGCTRYLWQRFCPGLPNYKLPTVCQAARIELDDHHDAGADSEACAGIAMAATRRFKLEAFPFHTIKKRETRERDQVYYRKLWDGEVRI